MEDFQRAEKYYSRFLENLEKLKCEEIEGKALAEFLINVKDKKDILAANEKSLKKHLQEKLEKDGVIYNGIYKDVSGSGFQMNLAKSSVRVFWDVPGFINDLENDDYIEKSMKELILSKLDKCKKETEVLGTYKITKIKAPEKTDPEPEKIEVEKNEVPKTEAVKREEIKKADDSEDNKNDEEVKPEEAAVKYSMDDLLKIAYKYGKTGFDLKDAVKVISGKDIKELTQEDFKRLIEKGYVEKHMSGEAGKVPGKTEKKHFICTNNKVLSGTVLKAVELSKEVFGDGLNIVSGGKMACSDKFFSWFKKEGFSNDKEMEPAEFGKMVRLLKKETEKNDQEELQF